MPVVPLWVYVLANLAEHRANTTASHAGLPYEANRDDLDAFLAVRLLCPVSGSLRLYGELGAGQRLVEETVVPRYDGVSSFPLTERTSDFLLVFAAGLQFRLLKAVSLGVRWEITPLNSDSDLAAYAAGLVPRSERMAVYAQVGFHF